ncbi:hypothetical protein EV127DRAFT_396591 [Xylaria flabelliformis]|nr:hypothetical protein EV127DRAFT_396591 [Xylaria flabelliformis]
MKMAPRNRVRRQLNNVLAQKPLVGATVSHAASPILNGNDLSDQGELDSQGQNNDSDSPKDHRKLGQGQSQMYARVLGREILIPRTFNSETYDPDAPPPGTPEPESHTPERYAAWGRDHFGEEWYKQRERMLQERNIYLDPDPVYEQRQRVLRVLEHTLEGRPSMPRFDSAEMGDETWMKLWARISKNLPQPSSPPSPSDKGSNNGNDTDLSGYSTYDPTPSPREPTPEPDDPFERLEFNRKRHYYSEEAYQFSRIFMLESAIDQRRKKREDEPGDNQREKVRDETEKIRFILGPKEESPEYELLMQLYDFWREGMTLEQIEVRLRESEERVAQLLAYIGRPVPEDPRYDEKQLEERCRAWDSMGFDKDLQEMLVRRLARPHLRPPSTERHSSVSSPQAKDTPHKTLSGRITKNAPKQRRNGRKSIANQQPASSSTEVLPPGPRRKPPRPNVLGELGSNTQAATGLRKPRKKYTKERASRRLAGKLPEFGMLPERSVMKAQSSYRASLQQSPNTRKVGCGSSKKLTAQIAKPQGNRAPCESGRGRSKKLAR